MSLDLIEGGRSVGGKLGHFLFDLRSGFAAGGGEASVPESDILP